MIHCYMLTLSPKPKNLGMSGCCCCCDGVQRRNAFEIRAVQAARVFFIFNPSYSCFLTLTRCRSRRFQLGTIKLYRTFVIEKKLTFVGRVALCFFGGSGCTKGSSLPCTCPFSCCEVLFRESGGLWISLTGLKFIFAPNPLLPVSCDCKAILIQEAKKPLVSIESRLTVNKSAENSG